MLRPLGFACAVIAPVPGSFEAPSSGNGPAAKMELPMANDLILAQSHAFQLSRDLMVPVTVFEIDGAYGVMPAAEYDGEEDAIINEFDPFEGGPAH